MPVVYILRVELNFFTVQPSFTTEPSNQTIVENEEVTLHCMATGNPIPEIAWIKDGKTVAQGDKLSFKANRSHSGEYWCKAGNGLDISINASAYLDVQCKWMTVLK